MISYINELAETASQYNNKIIVARKHITNLDNEETKRVAELEAKLVFLKGYKELQANANQLRQLCEKVKLRCADKTKQLTRPYKEAIAEVNGLQIQLGELEQRMEEMIRAKPEYATCVTTETYTEYNIAQCQNLIVSGAKSHTIKKEKFINAERAASKQIGAIEEYYQVLIALNKWFFEMVDDASVPKLGDLDLVGMDGVSVTKLLVSIYNTWICNKYQENSLAFQFFHYRGHHCIFHIAPFEDLDEYCDCGTDRITGEHFKYDFSDVVAFLKKHKTFPTNSDPRVASLKDLTVVDEDSSLLASKFYIEDDCSHNYKAGYDYKKHCSYGDLSESDPNYSECCCSSCENDDNY